jgi:hypothetical protein
VRDYRTAFNAANCIMIGPVANGQAALDILKNEVRDVAIIDLGNGLSFKVAQALADQDVPFAFATGYQCTELPAEFNAIICLSKPIDAPQLIAAREATLTNIVSRRNGQMKLGSSIPSAIG